MNTSPLSPEEIAAYAAGLFDGEGHVDCNISRPRGFRNFTTSLEISNQHYGALAFIRPHYGGRIESPSKGRLTHHWSVCGGAAERFAMSVVPYSIVKKEQLHLFLLARATFRARHTQGDRSIPDEVWVYREDLISQIRVARQSYVRIGAA